MSRQGWAVLAGIAVVLLVLPLALSRYGLTLATEVCIMAMFAMSLGLLVGYAGLASLGHAAYFCIGAYTVALLGRQIGSMYVLVGAAILLSAVAACGSGTLFIRASGAYFLMLTLAFGQVVYAIVFGWHGLTGGGDGTRVSVAPDLGFGALDRTGFYYLVAAVFVLCYLFLWRFVRSPAGVAVRGVKENEARMRALGYDIRAYKLLAFTIAGTIAGLAGALDAYYNRFVSPDLAYWTQSGQVLIMVIIGGAGTLLGPALGAAFYVLVQNYLSSYTERWPLIMGAIFVAFVLVGRGGILNLLAFAWRHPGVARFRRRAEAAQ
jgi:branched-chain amino acid transport system permease protein